MTGAAAGRRSHDSQDSRTRLLEAARTLFTERGYERTTVREIGRLADVDPALIARYFGSKAALYLESLRPAGTASSQTPIDLTGSLSGLFERVDASRPTPALHAAIQRHEHDEIQDAAVAVLTARLVEPLRARAADAGLDQAQLRAEVAVVALAGILLSRSSGALEAVTAASPDEIGAIVGALIDSITA